MRKRILFKAGSFGLIVAGLALPTFAQKHADQPARVLKAVDGDNDGTIDLAEAKRAASARFDRLGPRWHFDVSGISRYVDS
jgi:hypothetical protein